VNGREILRPLGSDLVEARRRAKLYQEEFQEVRVMRLPTGTVADFAERWFTEYVEQRRTGLGPQLARQRFRDYVKPVIGRSLLSEVRVDRLRAVRACAEAEGLKPQSVRHVLSDLRCLFRYALEVGELRDSPFRSSIMPRIPEEEPDRLTDEEVGKILAVTPPMYETAVRLALLTGLRWGELHRLQWRHVKELPEPHLVVEHTKSGKVRRIPLVPDAVEVLRRERERTTSVFVLGFRAKQPCNFVDRIEKASHVTWHFHQLRHTFACRWLEAGGSKDALQKILGHSTIRMTERYGQLSDDAVFAEAKRLRAL
jgi:integrase